MEQEIQTLTLPGAEHPPTEVLMKERYTTGYHSKKVPIYPSVSWQFFKRSYGLEIEAFTYVSKRHGNRFYLVPIKEPYKMYGTLTLQEGVNVVTERVNTAFNLVLHKFQFTRDTSVDGHELFTEYFPIIKLIPVDDVPENDIYPIAELLTELEIYFDKRADVDVVDERPVANKEMQLLGDVKLALEKLSQYEKDYVLDNSTQQELPINTVRGDNGTPAGPETEKDEAEAIQVPGPSEAPRNAAEDLDP